MKEISFNRGWKVKNGGSALMALFVPGGQAEKEVDLPYDAMIHETPAENTPGGGQTGFYPGGEYAFTKEFFAPEEWQEKQVFFRFEGIYQTAEIYVNDMYVASSLHGYGETLIEVRKWLKTGETNTIHVVAKNPSPNSRWYSGSGIYRPVSLMAGGPVFVLPDGLKVTARTASEEEALVEVSAKVKNIAREKKTIEAVITVSWEKEIVKQDRVRLSLWPEDEDMAVSLFCIREPKLWSPEDPALYDVQVQLLSGDKVIDEAAVRTGIRTVTFDGDHGLRINGKEEKMRGSCIHHDNGILGAATFDAAEDKRARELKEAGFNAIRSAHNPVSRAMLRACDKYGILVMDELSDMWNEEKNTNDFSLYFGDHWEEETGKMVVKDYNHPSVVLYSTGNEILDLGRENGGSINRKICRKFRELDPTRYTTTGTNGLIAALLRGWLPMITESVMKEAQEKTPAGGQDDGGVGAMNQAMGSLTDSDAFAVHPLMTEILEEAAQAADVPGLNYLTGRHVLEKELHPNKAMVATETYPADIVRLWRIVEENPHVTGDFTWTGYDYLGEAGCGIFYYDGKANFGSNFPDRLAYIGDINILGYRRPMSYLREIVFGLRKEPYLAVGRPDHYGETPSRTAWLYKDQIESWTWPGFEGTPVEVEVFSGSCETELLVNGVSCGRRKTGREQGFIASFNTIYQPGSLVAVSYDENGRETGRMCVETAGEPVKMKLKTEREVITAGGEDIAFVTATLTDTKGVPNRFSGQKKQIRVRVEGPGVLQAFGSADPQPQPEMSYDSDTWETFEGQVMAAVRSTEEAGIIRVIFSAEGVEEASAEIRAE